jgi:hypothetical protein
LWFGTILALSLSEEGKAMEKDLVSMCTEAERMLTHYVSALSIYHKAALSAVVLAESRKYNEALELKERAFQMLARAREDYWNHVSEHGCRKTVVAESDEREQATNQLGAAKRLLSSWRAASYR